MTRSEQACLLQRKASQDLAVLDKLLDDQTINDDTLGYHAQQAAEKLIKALLALYRHDYPRSHNIGLLLDLLISHGLPLPESFETLQSLTPFGSVFRSWPPLLHGLQAYVTAAIEAESRLGEEASP